MKPYPLEQKIWDSNDVRHEVFLPQRRLTVVAVVVQVDVTFSDEAPAVHLELGQTIFRHRQAEIEDFASLQVEGQVGGRALAGQVTRIGSPAAITLCSIRQNAASKK